MIFSLMNCLSFDVPRIRKTSLGILFTYEIEDQHTFFGYSEAWIYGVVCESMPHYSQLYSQLYAILSYSCDFLRIFSESNTLIT